MAYKIAEQTLSRGVTGTITAKRTLEDYRESAFIPDLYYYHLARSIFPHCAVTLLSGSSVLADFKMNQELYSEEIDGVYTTYHYVNVDANIGGNVAGDGSDTIYQQDVEVDSYAENADVMMESSNLSQMTIDAALPVQFKLTGNFEVWAEMKDDYVQNSPEEIFDAYKDDFSPFSRSPQTLEYFFVPLTLSLVVQAGPFSQSITLDPEDYGELFKHGMGEVSALIQFSYTKDTDNDLESVVQAGQLQIVGNIDSEVADVSGNVTIPGDTSGRYLTIQNNTLTAYAKADGDVTNAELHMTWPGGDVTFTGDVKHLDGVGVSGVQVEDLDLSTASTDSTGHAELTHHYNGKYSYGWSGYLTSVDDLPYPGNNALGVYGIGVKNCEALQEPHYPGTATLTAFPEYQPYDDSRLECDSPNSNGSGALTVTAKDSLDIFTHGTGDWTGTNCTIQAVSDGILVTPIADNASLKRASSSTDIRGWRLLSYGFESTDTGSITVTIAGRTYTINPSNYVIDVLNYSGSNSTANNAYGLADPPACMGIGQLGEIVLSGLRLGKTYTFKTVQAQRLPSERRYIKAYIDPVFIGDKPGDSRVGDGVGMFSEGSSKYIGKSGVVVVDGVVGFELYDMEHESTPDSIWYHTPLAFSSSKTVDPTPTSSMCLSVSYASGSANQLITYLRPGVYTSTLSSLSISYKERISRISVPYCLDKRSFSFYKQFRGATLLQLAGTVIANKDVSIKTLRRSGDTNPSLSTATTDNYGTLWLPANKQPLVIRGTVEAIDESNVLTVSGLPGDYTGFECFYGYDNDGVINPIWTTITSQSGNSIQVDSSSMPRIGDWFYVYLDYRYELSVDGADPVTVKLRNHNLSFALIANIYMIHGPTYHPVSNWPTYVPDSNMPEYI